MHDLGEVWRQWTGLPWCSRSGLFVAPTPSPTRAWSRTSTAFVRSRDEALGHVDAVAPQAARWEVFDARTLATFLRTLDFRLGERQLAGLSEFARGAASAGTVATEVTPAFAEV